MFFSLRKKKKLAEEAFKKEQEHLLRKKTLQKAQAYYENIGTFFRITEMVRSLPKERQIVVVQRISVFKDNHERNRCYHFNY